MRYLPLTDADRREMLAKIGVKSVDAGHRDVMTSLNATNWQIFKRLELPSSLPYIITGMEVGIVLAIIGAIMSVANGPGAMAFTVIERAASFDASTRVR